MQFELCTSNVYIPTHTGPSREVWLPEQNGSQTKALEQTMVCPERFGTEVLSQQRLILQSETSERGDQLGLVVQALSQRDNGSI